MKKKLSISYQCHRCGHDIVYEGYGTDGHADGCPYGD